MKAKRIKTFTVYSWLQGESIYKFKMQKQFEKNLLQEKPDSIFNFKNSEMLQYCYFIQRNFTNLSNLYILLKS